AVQAGEVSDRTRGVSRTGSTAGGVRRAEVSAVTGVRNANVEEGRMSDKARVVGAIALAGCLIGLSGCDWWPPALQQQIGELEAKVKAAEAEKSAVRKKMADVSQAAEDCRAQSDQMVKTQADLKARV